MELDKRENFYSYHHISEQEKKEYTNISLTIVLLNHKNIFMTEILVAKSKSQNDMNTLKNLPQSMHGQRRHQLLQGFP